MDKTFCSAVLVTRPAADEPDVQALFEKRLGEGRVRKTPISAKLQGGACALNGGDQSQPPDKKNPEQLPNHEAQLWKTVWKRLKVQSGEVAT